MSNADDSLKEFESANGAVTESRRQFPPNLFLTEKTGNYVDGIVVRVRHGNYQGKPTLNYAVKVLSTNARMYRTNKEKNDPETGMPVKEFIDLPSNGIVDVKANTDLQQKDPQPVEGQRVHITFLRKEKGKAPQPKAIFRLILGKVEATEQPGALPSGEI